MHGLGLGIGESGVGCFGIRISLEGDLISMHAGDGAIATVETVKPRWLHSAGAVGGGKQDVVEIGAVAPDLGFRIAYPC